MKVGFLSGVAPRRTVGTETVILSTSLSGAPVLLLNAPDSGRVPVATGKKQRQQIAKTKEAKALLRDIRRTWRHETLRLERMMRDTRSFSAELWKDRYLDHPIVGQISRKLLWQVGNTLIGFTPSSDPEHWSRMTDIDGSPFEPSGGEMVRLWHPCELTEGDRLAWERWVLDRRLIQPFQQALRPVYRPAPEEEFEDVRFAGDLLRQRTLAAVCRERGWNHRFPDGELTCKTPVLPNGTVLRASVNANDVVETLGESGFPEILHPIESISFHAQSRRERVALKNVPPVIFSEIMRDVDFFIAASRATSP